MSWCWMSRRIQLWTEIPWAVSVLAPSGFILRLIIRGLLTLRRVGVRVTARISHKCLPYPNRVTFSSSAKSPIPKRIHPLQRTMALWATAQDYDDLWGKVHCHIWKGRRRTVARRHMSWSTFVSRNCNHSRLSKEVTHNHPIQQHAIV